MQGGSRVSLDDTYAPDIERIMIGGHEIAVVDREMLAARMVDDCFYNRKRRGPPRLIFDANGQSVSLIGRNPDFAAAMAAADLIHADGMSLVTASRILTAKPLPERIAVTDFIEDAAVAAGRHGLSFFILGGTDSRNEAACDELRREYPDLRIVGRHHGYFDLSESSRICALVRDSGADVLWVGLGRPLQEIWCARHRDELEGVGWVKTCGGLLGFLAHEERRAPRWMQRTNLEWLYRVMHDPMRLGARYLVTNPHAVYRMLLHTARQPVSLGGLPVGEKGMPVDARF